MGSYMLIREEPPPINWAFHTFFYELYFILTAFFWSGGLYFAKYFDQNSKYTFSFTCTHHSTMPEPRTHPTFLPPYIHTVHTRATHPYTYPGSRDRVSSATLGIQPKHSLTPPTPTSSTFEILDSSWRNGGGGVGFAKRKISISWRNLGKTRTFWGKKLVERTLFWSKFWKRHIFWRHFILNNILKNVWKA